MTHNRRSTINKADMESYEKEMRSRKVQSQTDKMNSSSRNSGSQERGRQSNNASKSRGRSAGGRSSSRGPPPSQSGGRRRSQSRGRQMQQSGGGNDRVPRDPSCSTRSKSRNRRSNTPGIAASSRSQRDKSLPRRSNTPGPATASSKRDKSVTRRSASQGRGGNSQRSTTRPSPDEYPPPSFDSIKKLVKGTVNKVADAYSEITSSTPETGPLSFHSGKSSSRRSLSKQHSLDDNASNNSRPATPNRVPSVNGDDSTATGGRDDEEIMTYLFDRKGYCIRHPHIRLRKKKLLGGWQVLITHCPSCCVEEMNRLKR